MIIFICYVVMLHAIFNNSKVCKISFSNIIFDAFCSALSRNYLKIQLSLLGFPREKVIHYRHPSSLWISDPSIYCLRVVWGSIEVEVEADGGDTECRLSGDSAGWLVESRQAGSSKAGIWAR